MQGWFLAHFPGFYNVDPNPDYMQNYPVAAKWVLHKGHGEGVTYHSLLDKVAFDDVNWRSYEEHMKIQDFEEIMCGVDKVYRHLPERVRRQYGYVQNVPRHPTVVITLLPTLRFFHLLLNHINLFRSLLHNFRS